MQPFTVSTWPYRWPSEPPCGWTGRGLMIPFYRYGNRGPEDPELSCPRSHNERCTRLGCELQVPDVCPHASDQPQAGQSRGHSLLMPLPPPHCLTFAPSRVSACEEPCLGHGCVPSAQTARYTVLAQLIMKEEMTPNKQSMSLKNEAPDAAAPAPSWSRLPACLTHAHTQCVSRFHPSSGTFHSS